MTVKKIASCALWALVADLLPSSTSCFGTYVQRIVLRLNAAPGPPDSGCPQTNPSPEYHLEGVVFRGYFLHEVFADYR
jgi:hypothetical protein